MSPQSARTPSASTPMSLWRRPDDLQEPSPAVVAAVLAFGDLRQLREDGAIVIRLSRERVLREDMTMLLQEEALGALDVSVIFREEPLPLGATGERRLRRPVRP